MCIKFPIWAKIALIFSLINRYRYQSQNGEKKPWNTCPNMEHGLEEEMIYFHVFNDDISEIFQNKQSILGKVYLDTHERQEWLSTTRKISTGSRQERSNELLERCEKIPIVALIYMRNHHPFLFFYISKKQTNSAGNASIIS